MITKFDGEYDFLSNFYPCKFTYKGRTFLTTEQFFQAYKAADQEGFELVMEQTTPSGAKWAGRQIKMRDDWEEVKDSVMLIALCQKFAKPELREKLLATGDEGLVEGNTWHDCYWGVCSCERCGGNGKNHLGKLLMKVRDEIREVN